MNRMLILFSGLFFTSTTVQSSGSCYPNCAEDGTSEPSGQRALVDQKGARGTHIMGPGTQNQRTSEPPECSVECAGEDGIPGLDGLPGQSGRPGFRGLPGQTGPRGEKGACLMEPEHIPTESPYDPTGCNPDCAGEHGIPGHTGLPGLPGRPGDDGMPGQTGPRGGKGSCSMGPEHIPIDCPIGQLGEIGLYGQKGDMGDPGFDGAPGHAGFPGISGEEGGNVHVVTSIQELSDWDVGSMAFDLASSTLWLKVAREEVRRIAVDLPQ